MIESKGVLVTRTQLAKILVVTQPAIKSWELSRGFSSCYDGNKINLERAIRWMYEWKNEVDESKSETNASERKKLYDGLKAEASYKQMIGELVPKNEFLSIWKECLLVIKQNFMALPDRIAPELNLDQSQKDFVESVCKSVLMQVKQSFNGSKKDWVEFTNGNMPKEQKDVAPE